MVLKESFKLVYANMTDLKSIKSNNFFLEYIFDEKIVLKTKTEEFFAHFVRF